MIVNKDHPLERRRSTLAHELAHRIFDGGYIGDDEEKAAQRFAGSFLVQRDHLRRNYGAHPRARLAYEEIIRLKHLYRVSAATIVVRLEQIDIISKPVVSTLFQTVGRKWRSSEPAMIEKDEDRGSMEVPERFRRITLYALAENYIPLAKAMELLRETPKQIERALNGPVDVSNC